MRGSGRRTKRSISQIDRDFEDALDDAVPVRKATMSVERESIFVPRLQGTPGATIQDVARGAGVSAASVSNLLNGRMDRMRANTRARIEEVIAELDYRPNPIARQLKTGRAPMVGLMARTVANPFYGELAVAIERIAQGHGYHLLLCNTLRDPDRERAFAEEIAAMGVRGLIYCSGTGEAERLDEFLKRGISVVAFDVDPRDPLVEGVDTVTLDNEAATRLAIDHLVSLGHRDIGYVSATVSIPSRKARLRGYELGMAAHGLSVGPYYVDCAKPSFAPYRDVDHGELGRLAGRQMAVCNPRPTAIVCMNDTIALGVMAGLSECGFGIPGDVSVVGLDDIQYAALARPPLTTIRQSLAEMAGKALEQLCARLSEPGKPSALHVVVPELVVRGSTAPPTARGKLRTSTKRAL